MLAPDADPQGYELTMLTASPDWARVAAAAGVPMNVRLVPDAGWARKAGVGAQGAVLVRPDRVIAWRAAEPPGAEALENALRTVFDP